ncbi:sensor histidine kinase [Dyella tabacisoli]|uniref:histidine kinase n=1 Tax=Dyella tabacisoli TaxID=2282381 RepID=A0A369UKS5_9GAMM|nr:HAMP domain-containing sensor histidine kinase [Dyella tabacisoli]RDD80200.1 sensor histidine kinase [Dyella tabacisoli]
MLPTPAALPRPADHADDTAAARPVKHLHDLGLLPRLFIDVALPCTIAVGAVVAILSLQEHSEWFAAICGSSIVLLALLSRWSLQHRVLAPLKQLQTALTGLLEGREALPSKSHGSAEFDQLDALAQRLSARLTEHRRDWASIQRSSAIDALDQLRQSQAAMRGKAQFMAQVGHHFRQPLQALQLFAASMHPGIDEQQAVLKQMRASISTMTRLLDALLEISRLDAGIVATHPARFFAADLFLRDRSWLSREAARRGVTLVWRGGHHGLHGDLALTTHLLLLLATNAITYTQGRVMIAARRRASSVRIEVRDNGPGIAAIHQQRIFEEFVQLHGSDADRGEGYGLGLAIAERVARVLGTRIGLRSEPGRGSLFWFELPGVASTQRTGIGRRRRVPHAQR